MTRLKPVLVWRKHFCSGKGQEFLEPFADIDPTRLIVSSNPPKPGIQVEIYPSGEAQGRHLVKTHGGKLLRMAPKSWWLPQEPRSEPLRIGRKLLVVTTRAQKKYWESKYPARKLLVIPASLAFGTGEHATTQMCLKQIAQINDWEEKKFLDIGTGTGILAISARILGCAQVEAFDNDPRAIEVAKENERENFSKKFTLPPINWKVCGIEKFKKNAAYDFLAANLYSELLIRHSSQIARALKPGGMLLLSGIFEDQIDTVKKTFNSLSLQPMHLKRKGQWWCVTFFKVLKEYR